MNVGKFDTILRIRKPTESSNASGEIISTWILHYETWGERKQVTQSEKEEYEARQLVSSDFTEFRIRFPLHTTLPTTKMRVIETVLGLEYDIENIRIEGRNQFLVLICKQRQQR